MKLEDIKAPKGFVIRGYETPEPGDYILCPDNTFDIASVPLVTMKHFCLVLDRVWEPEKGKYYEFSDDKDFLVYIKMFSHINKSASSQPTTPKYTDTDGIEWRYIRPVQGELGK